MRQTAYRRIENQKKPSLDLQCYPPLQVLLSNKRGIHEDKEICLLQDTPIGFESLTSINRSGGKLVRKILILCAIIITSHLDHDTQIHTFYSHE